MWAASWNVAQWGALSLQGHRWRCVRHSQSSRSHLRPALVTTGAEDGARARVRACVCARASGWAEKRRGHRSVERRNAILARGCGGSRELGAGGRDGVRRIRAASQSRLQLQLKALSAR